MPPAVGFDRHSSRQRAPLSRRWNLAFNLITKVWWTRAAQRDGVPNGGGNTQPGFSLSVNDARRFWSMAAPAAQNDVARAFPHIVWPARQAKDECFAVARSSTARGENTARSPLIEPCVI